MDLVLASTSPYRKALLERLQISFNCVPPGVDETRLPAEAPDALAQRLALEKARAVARQYNDALVIGSDQVASLDGVQLDKPGTHQVAREQLLNSAGREVVFFTAVALVSPGRQLEQVRLATTTGRFRKLTGEQIEDYLLREQPYDCAGSFKVESLGIALFERIDGEDPTALEGLPLIALATLLCDAGVDVLRN